MSSTPDTFLGSILGAEPAALAELPTAKHEDWRFSETRALYAMRFSGPAAPVACGAAVLADSQGSFLSTGNGVVVGQASDGFFAGRFEDLPADLQAVVSDALGTASPWNDGFCDLHGAMKPQVACVVVPRGTQLETPIHVLNWASGDGAMAQRLVIIAGRESKFTVVEDYQGDGAYFRNAWTEVVVGENAQVSHIRVQQESPRAAHMLRSGVRVATHGHYDSYTVSCGGAWSRHDLYARHEGEGAFARIDGLALATDAQLSDTHSVIDNTRPHCESHQLHKSIVGGKAHSVFNGKILVQKGAQKIDAYQLNRSLLLSTTARVDTKPQLEIFADDVKCSHGATVGQLDDEQVFYLRSRGFDESAARGMLTYAFAGEILEEISVRELRTRLEAVAHAHTR